ncbi:MAG: MFS transporter, partial [Cytophagia bacterium]|nr:MFS transporter [Cytophagia bacterium]
MTLNQRFQEVRHGFSSTFWIANVLELFERLAFYGAKAILAFYLAKKVGLEDEAGALVGTFFTGVIFFLPIFTGVLVDKYGFKKTLMACFSVFAIGYFLIALAGMEWGKDIVA